MKVIAVMSEKGGIGKTTTAAALAEILANWDAHVLAIDADQQGNLSALFGADDPEQGGLSQLLEATNKEVKISDVIRTTSNARVDIITANGYLQQTNIEIATDDVNDQAHRLKEALGQLYGPLGLDTYDFVICDCGLVIDMAVLNVLVAADLVIAPTKPGGFEAEALVRMRDRVAQLEPLNPELELRALVTMCGGSKANVQAEEWIKRASGVKAYMATIHRSVIAEKYTAARMPLPRFSPRCKAAKDYERLVIEIIMEEAAQQAAELVKKNKITLPEGLLEVLNKTGSQSDTRLENGTCLI